MGVARIDGFFEAHLTVSDLDRSIGFHRDVLGLEVAHTVPGAVRRMRDSLQNTRVDRLETTLRLLGRREEVKVLESSA